MTDSIVMELRKEIDPDDRAFWQEVRRGLITIARAVAKRYNCRGLLIVLGVE